MSEPYISEIRMMSFGFAPKGWALCNGQVLPITQNKALFSLLGTTFGGDGRINFALPDLRDRVPMHVGDGHVVGEQIGQQQVTLRAFEMPAHTHDWIGTTLDANTANPTDNLFGAVSNVYTGANNLTMLHPASITAAGGSQPHDNMQPYLTLSFCIALQGEYPPRP